MSAAYDEEQTRTRPVQLPATVPADREPPHNLEAEQGLLGAILVNNGAYDRVADFLRPEHFADPVNGRIYAACARAIERGEQASPITLKRQFDQDESLRDVGGASYLVRLAASVVTVINVADYGREIRDCAIRRALLLIGHGIVETAHRSEIDGAEADADGLVQHAQAHLDDLQGSGVAKPDYRAASFGVAAAVARVEKAWRDGPEAIGVSTGISDLDRAIGGLSGGSLYIDAARPAMGKTALALRIARNVAKRGLPVGFLSLEAPADEMGARLLAMEAGVSQERQDRGDIQEGDWANLVDAQQTVTDWPLYIDDLPSQSVNDVRRRALRLRRKHGLALLVVDYLQLLAPGNTRGRPNQNRVEDVSEITRGLKALAMELEIPVLALSQLSRAVEQREDKRPILSDLRESGSIEHDADVVMFIYRDQYYLERAEPMHRADESAEKFLARQDDWDRRMEQARNVMEVGVAKRRRGPTGRARLYANLATGVIENGIWGGHS